MSAQWSPAEGRRVRFQVMLEAVAQGRLRCCGGCLVLPPAERIRARRILRIARRVARSWR